MNLKSTPMNGLYTLTRIMCNLTLAIAAALSLPVGAAPVMAIRVGPMDANRMDVSLVLTAGALKECSGTYRGIMQLYEVSPGIPVSGRLKNDAGTCELTSTLPWSSLSDKVLRKARGDALQVRFKGDVVNGKTTTSVNWMLSAPKPAVLLHEPMKTTVQRFAKATELQLGTLGLKSSTVNIDIQVKSPLHFDLQVVQALCDLEIHGKPVAKGLKENFILSGSKTSTLRIPVVINHQALLAASGNVFSQMGKVDGKVVGMVRMRLNSGQVEFPMEFPIKLSVL